MPRKRTIPPYPARAHHSGQARIRLGTRHIYLGTWGTDESHQRYEREIAQWLLAGGVPPSPAPESAEPITISEVLARYWRHAQAYYVKHGKPTRQLPRIRTALRPVRELFGAAPAADFGPRAMKLVRERLISGVCRNCPGEPCERCAGTGRRTWTRKQVNSWVGCIVRAFRWAAEEELIPGSIWQALKAVRGLSRGRSAARESPPVRPVPAAHVEATLPELTPVVADMVRLQHLAGMRPGEVCALRPADIDRAGQVPDGPCYPGVWVYLPGSWKTEHHEGARRVIFFGPQAQRLLAPYLAGRDPTQPCFSPAEATDRWLREHGRSIRRGESRTPGDAYTTQSYGRALAKAAKRAGVPRWAPNQLRHARATELRTRYGREGLPIVSAVLGHAGLEVASVYAEQSLERAAEAMLAMG